MGTRRRKRTSSEEKSLARYWGYSLLLALYAGWFHYGFPPAVMGSLSSLVVFYTLFQVPVPCCAENRDKTRCRRDSSGFLGACTLEQHKWQNAFILFKRQSWVKVLRVICTSVNGNIALFGMFAAVLSAIAAATQAFLK